MSDQFEQDRTERNGPPRDPDANDYVARLMRLAGPRPVIPAGAEQRVRDRVRQEWRFATRRRRARRWYVPLAVAASLVLGLALTLQPPLETPALATVARVNGPAAAAGIATGQVVLRGDTVSTTSRQTLSLALDNGVSLRLAANTAVRLDEATAVSLLRGEAYVDSGPGRREERLVSIHTPLGVVTDVGTQFATRYANGVLRVAVREGRVDVMSDQRSLSASGGELLHVRPDSEPMRERISPNDPSWAWAAAVAPAFEIENRSLLEFLEWAARETGRELVFESSETRAAAAQTVLHGSVDDFTPAEATQAVLSTTGFVVRLEPGRLVIGRR